METTGFDELNTRIQGHQKRFSRFQLEAAAIAGAEKAEEWLKEDLRKPKSGRKWPRLPEVSSRQDETPAVQSGELIENTRAKKGKSTKYKAEAYLDSEGKHAFWMEFGWTTRDGQVHYRPFHRTFVAGKAAELQKVMRDALKK